MDGLLGCTYKVPQVGDAILPLTMDGRPYQPRSPVDTGSAVPGHLPAGVQVQADAVELCPEHHHPTCSTRTSPPQSCTWSTNANTACNTLSTPKAVVVPAAPAPHGDCAKSDDPVKPPGRSDNSSDIPDRPPELEKQAQEAVCSLASGGLGLGVSSPAMSGFHRIVGTQPSLQSRATGPEAVSW